MSTNLWERYKVYRFYSLYIINGGLYDYFVLRGEKKPYDEDEFLIFKNENEVYEFLQKLVKSYFLEAEKIWEYLNKDFFYRKKFNKRTPK